MTTTLACKVNTRRLFTQTPVPFLPLQYLYLPLPFSYTSLPWFPFFPLQQPLLLFPSPQSPSSPYSFMKDKVPVKINRHTTTIEGMVMFNTRALLEHSVKSSRVNVKNLNRKCSEKGLRVRNCQELWVPKA